MEPLLPKVCSMMLHESVCLCREYFYYHQQQHQWFLTIFPAYTPAPLLLCRTYTLIQCVTDFLRNTVLQKWMNDVGIYVYNKYVHCFSAYMVYGNIDYWSSIKKHTTPCGKSQTCSSCWVTLSMSSFRCVFSSTSVVTALVAASGLMSVLWDSPLEARVTSCSHKVDICMHKRHTHATGVYITPAPIHNDICIA